VEKSLLWHKAVERYREELEDNDEYDNIIRVGSLEDLLNDTEFMESLLPHKRTPLSTIRHRLGLKLKFMDDFSTIIALCVDTNAAFTALIWGSIRLILTLTSSSTDLLQDVLDMLEDLSLKLPRLKEYKTPPKDRALGTALLDVYTEVICFYSRSIHFFRTHPHVLLRRSAWEKFQLDFGRTIQRIKKMSTTVESEAYLARMGIEDVKYKEVLQLMDDLKKSQIHDDDAIRCYHIPSELNRRFWGREQALQAVETALKPNDGTISLQSFALYGMGGVGKTQIALQYANRNRERFKVILWVAADSTISIEQSFLDIARNLGLAMTNEDIPDAVTAMLKVKSWLAKSRKSISVYWSCSFTTYFLHRQL
jgi:hypothetical protein